MFLVGKDRFKMQNGTHRAVVQIDSFCAISCGINACSIIVKSFKISFISFAEHRKLP